VPKSPDLPDRRCFHVSNHVIQCRIVNDGGIRLAFAVEQQGWPTPVRADVSRKSATMTEDGRLHLRAKVMASRHALMTVHATARVPTNADALSDFEAFGARTKRRDSTDDFVAENRGILRNAPFIVEDRKIGVTQTAVVNRDFNFSALSVPDQRLQAPSAVSRTATT
jgi:hypothetical protein